MLESVGGPLDAPFLDRNARFGLWLVHHLDEMDMASLCEALGGEHAEYYRNEKYRLKDLILHGLSLWQPPPWKEN